MIQFPQILEICNPRRYRLMSLRNLIPNFVLFVMTVVFAAIVVFYICDLYEHGKKKKYVAWFSSASFVLLTFPISTRLIYMHLSHWHQPRVQKYIVRIITMIPIYSIESWLALRFKEFALYIETLRECYEAYAIFNFLYFLIAVLGDESHIIFILKEKQSERGAHQWPISLFLSPWIMGYEFLMKCKFGVLQYVVLKIFTGVMIVILETFSLYGEGQFRWDRGFVYMCTINNLSQLWALYCMILFYLATREELAPWRPVGKFLCVKMVVFFTWWQSMALDLYYSTKRTQAVSYHHQAHVSKLVQDYAICVEMLLASIAFTSAFTHKDYVITNVSKSKQEDNTHATDDDDQFFAAVVQSTYPDDVFTDLRRVARGQDEAAHGTPLQVRSKLVKGKTKNSFASNNEGEDGDGDHDVLPSDPDNEEDDGDDDDDHDDDGDRGGGDKVDDKEADANDICRDLSNDDPDFATTEKLSSSDFDDGMGHIQAVSLPTTTKATGAATTATRAGGMGGGDDEEVQDLEEEEEEECTRDEYVVISILGSDDDIVLESKDNLQGHGENQGD